LDLVEIWAKVIRFGQIWLDLGKIKIFHLQNHSLITYDYEPFYESKLELKSNSSEILPVNCKFICDSTSTGTDKTQA